MTGTAQAARGATQRARRGAEQTKHSTWVEGLGRAGYVAMGASYAIVAYLALRIAIGSGGSTTDHRGALEGLGHERGGGILLGILAAGFAGYAVFRFVQAVLDRDDEGSDASGLAKRAGYLGRGLVGAALCAIAVSVLVGSGGGGSGGSEKQGTATILGWPGGPLIVGAAGVAIVAVGVYQVVRAFIQDWEEDLRDDAGPTARRSMAVIGAVGLAARGVVFGLIGAFLVKAAVEYDPKDAIGLDGALRTLADQAYGQWLLGATAAGLLAYAIFCVAQARYRDV